MEQQPQGNAPPEHVPLTNPIQLTASELCFPQCAVRMGSLTLCPRYSVPGQSRASAKVPTPLTVYDIPEEILVDIFFIFINNTRPASRKEQSIGPANRSKYQRLFVITSVCSDWRNICLSRSAFWSLIPLCKEWRASKYIVDLCLSRAGATDIYLSGGLGGSTKHRFLEIIPKCGPRIHGFEVYGHHAEILLAAVSKLVEHGRPGELTSLSVQNYQINHDDNYCPEHSLILPISSPEYDQLNGFVEHLHSLRLYGFELNWGQLRFSELVDLSIQYPTVGGFAKVGALLSAIASAPKLQRVELVSLRANLDDIQNRVVNPKGSITVFHPSLQLLFLKNIRWDRLCCIIRSMIPGSYRVVISYTRKGYINGQSFEGPTLHGYNIDTLLISRSWVDPDILNSLLNAIPTIRALSIAHFEFTKELFEALVQPLGASAGDGVKSFPSIRRLGIIGSAFSEDGLDGLKGVVISHGILELTLGGSASKLKSIPASTKPGRWVRFEDPEDDECTSQMKEWLQVNVPKYSVVTRFSDFPDIGFQSYEK